MNVILNLTLQQETLKKPSHNHLKIHKFMKQIFV